MSNLVLANDRANKRGKAALVVGGSGLAVSAVAAFLPFVSAFLLFAVLVVYGAVEIKRSA